MKHIKIGNIAVPSFFYGTAWKEEKTEGLVIEAVKAGFRGIDTANQRRHYYERAVGEALKKLYHEGEVRREDLFLQSKYTFQVGQDHRLPYDPKADFTTQVHQSFAGSLEHLGTDSLDSYVLHGPATRTGLTDADWEAWRAIEGLYREGKSKLIGVSNVNFDQLETLIQDSEVTPHFVQNRCYAATQWDRPIRELCRQHSIVYQGFSLLTANRQELSTPQIKDLAIGHSRTIAQVIFRFSLQVGMLPLTGTTDPSHMREDLEVYDFELTDEEVKVVEEIAVP